MAKMTVYKPDGEAVEMECVDARECIEFCGYTLEPTKVKGSLMAMHKKVTVSKGTVSKGAVLDDSDGTVHELP